MTANAPSDVAAQYATDTHLRTRMHTHEQYTAGPELEPAVDVALALTGKESLLDVGCGPGGFLGRLRTSGHTGPLTGVDLSAGMIATAQAAHPDVTYMQASADALPFPDATFDVLTARHMLYHVPSVPAALHEFRRVLRPGGRFMAVTNTAGYMAELWALTDDAARIEPALKGLSRTRGDFAAAFSETNGEAWIRNAFGNVHVTLTDSALVFPNAAPVLAYLESLIAWQHLTVDEQARGRDALAHLLDQRLGNGPWRVSKRMALITATRE